MIGCIGPLKNKISKLNFKIQLSENIEDSIKSFSKKQNTIILCIGSLYLMGEILNLSERVFNK